MFICRDVINKGNVTSVQFYTRGCEAEESPLLEALAKERLVKTQQVGKVLAGAVVICELWRLLVSL
jgi:hypothetical protein